MKPSFWEQRRLIRESSLTSQLKWLVTVLADYAGESEWSFPSQTTLARDLSTTKRHVIRLLNQAIDQQVIESKRRQRQTNKYRIRWERIGDLSVTTKQDLEVTPESPIGDPQVTPPSDPQVTQGVTPVSHRTSNEHPKRTSKERKSARKPKKRFVKPTCEEVAEYCQQRNNSIDAEHFIDHYEANGWKRGRTAIQDWKAAVRTWERNGFSNNGRQSGTEAWKRTRREAELNDD